MEDKGNRDKKDITFIISILRDKKENSISMKQEQKAIKKTNSQKTKKSSQEIKTW